MLWQIMKIKIKIFIIKKIELIKLNKTRSNSNRNTKFKDKLINNNVNSDNNNNNNINNNANIKNNNKNNNNQKSIKNIIKSIKSLDTKNIQNQTNLAYKNKIGVAYHNSITSVNTQMNKNLSEKLVNYNNNKKYKNISNKNYISRNKSKKDYSNSIKFIRNDDKNTFNINFQLSNSNNYSKKYSYIGLYHKKTISKERKQSKLSEDMNEILHTHAKNPTQINNLFYCSPLNRTKKILL